jgi:uncharacterized protein (TIGR01319 family)
MSPVPLEPLSILAIDIGTVHTRAFLFDVVEDSYHLIASGSTRSTHEPPLGDINIGVLNTVRQLQEVTGRVFLSQKNTLIVPSQAGSEGVDRFFVSHSFGPFIKIATFGLSNDVSLKAINKLAATTYGTIVQSIGINDKRTLNDQIDDVVNAAPEMILFAGGTDRGSSRAVKKMSNLIAAILQLIPAEQRPWIIYSGNQVLYKSIKEQLGSYTKIADTVNIRPATDEDKLSAVTNELADLFTNLRGEQYGAIKRITPECSDSPCPSATGVGRIVQFLSEVGDPEKGIMAVDVGAGSSTIASASAGKLDLNVFPVGIGPAFKPFLESTPFEQISRWFPAGVSLEEARDQLWQKTVFPRNLPESPEGLAVEHAAVKQLLFSLMTSMADRGLLVANGYDTILCSGMPLTQMGTPDQLLMMLLDGLQPIGISTFVLDKYNLLPSLGAAARISPLMPIQVLESTAFINLATVIGVKSSAKPGTTLMRVKYALQGEETHSLMVKQGALIKIPFKPGVKAAIQIQPTRQAQIDSSALTDSAFRINGGLCGLIIDARGRAIKLPTDNAKRCQTLQTWTDALKNE